MYALEERDERKVLYAEEFDVDPGEVEATDDEVEGEDEKKKKDGEEPGEEEVL